MPEDRDQLDIDLLRPIGSEVSSPTYRVPNMPAGSTNWLSLYFRCSNLYVRAYKNETGTAYRGQCPRCGKSMLFRIGPGGTSKRSFAVSCR